jgi:hypothetical protein
MWYALPITNGRERAMPSYTLTAKYGGEVETVIIASRDDDYATLDAIGEIMNRAYPDVALWARGEITLANARGDIINTMPAKV